VAAEHQVDSADVFQGVVVEVWDAPSTAERRSTSERKSSSQRDADEMEVVLVEGRMIESHPMLYVTNDLGDIYARRRDDGTIEPFDPDDFGWVGPRNRSEKRRSLDQIETLPDFSVRIESGPQFVPGQRPPRSRPWLQWNNGAAPPAAAESRSGSGGTLAYHDRLSDALGSVAEKLPGAPDRSPFIVHDFVGGRLITVEYQPPPLQPDGPGTVYVLDDGDGFKIGYTNGYVAARVAALQTGNPRLIRPVAQVNSASEAVEAHLQAEFGQWNLRGEWFERAPLEELAAGAGGWEELLRRRLPPSPGDWDILIFDASP
jgi:hypothetical protein